MPALSQANYLAPEASPPKSSSHYTDEDMGLLYTQLPKENSVAYNSRGTPCGMYVREKTYDDIVLVKRATVDPSYRYNHNGETLPTWRIDFKIVDRLKAMGGSRIFLRDFEMGRLYETHIDTLQDNTKTGVWVGPDKELQYLVQPHWCTLRAHLSTLTREERRKQAFRDQATAQNLWASLFGLQVNSLPSDSRLDAIVTDPRTNNVTHFFEVKTIYQPYSRYTTQHTTVQFNEQDMDAVKSGYLYYQLPTILFFAFIDRAVYTMLPYQVTHPVKDLLGFDGKPAVLLSLNSFLDIPPEVFGKHFGLR